MSASLHERKSALVAQAIERASGKFPPEQGKRIAQFLRQYYDWVAPEDLIDRSVLDLYGAALSHWNLAQKRLPGQRLLRVYNPRSDEHGWQSTHTIIELVTEDSPFLVDSLSMELNRLGMTVHLIVHPVLRVRRDGHGQVVELAAAAEAAGAAHAEALLHIEVDRQSDSAQLAQIEHHLNRILDDVRAAVEDWAKMRQRLHSIVAELRRQPPAVDLNELDEQLAFLEWMDDGHFIFLGFREYALAADSRGDDALRVVPESGLGILRSDTGEAFSKSFASLPQEIRKLVHKPELLIITKSGSRATVHRPGYMDYVGIKRFDSKGEVVGEWRMLGLYTSTAYISRPAQIPLLRHKVQQVMQRAGFRPGGHSAKALVNILETLPRDELFQGSVEELYDIAMGILHLQERQRVRLLVRRDPFGRFLSCLVFMPRERFNTQVRMRVQDLLLRTFNAKSIDFSVSLSESVLARLYFVVHTEPGKLPDFDIEEVERKVRDATRSWDEDLQTALLHELGEADGNRLYARYRAAFPASYREDYAPAVSVSDIRKIEALDSEHALGIALYQPLETSDGKVRFKLFRRGNPIPLSQVLPMLENMGVRVIDERPHEIKPDGAPGVWVHDLGMTCDANVRFDTDRIRQLFQDAFLQVWLGNVENDGFNRLVLYAQLPWRSVVVLRACCKYLRQTGFAFSQSYIEQALTNHPQIASLLVDLFLARFDPQTQDQAIKRSEILRDAIKQSLDAVPNLDEDRIMRRFLLLIEAMLRTNFFQPAAEGAAKEYLSFKLDPSSLPDLPSPRPQFEVFVYSRRMEGVHLRGGHVARGGIRWSDRLEDFRTEVFHLMKTQMVKNAVIVPVGAKGGFVVKQPPQDHDAAALKNEVKHCYRTLIRGLLDITDNLVGGRVAPPPSVVRYDCDDPYLVVAADKGTASFSDIANGIAKEYNFWLGDAFASGGSAGYDHKKMAITARGAWECVKRLFRELSMDIQAQNFTVIGIGSMSGDVFGNGMLLSRHIKLLGAFSHSHIFLDPNPDPELSFRERERLFNSPGGSWKDYDIKLISKGGGVYARSAKSIPLSPEARQALDVTAESLTPNELIRAMLIAPVDLLWNGGIGTFVKARHQSNVDVGDRSNDAIRVNGDELRCRVVGEGGNLGFTASARIEYALHGGRINTDFIDNSGGVDCSDHEVNIKILLDEIVKNGDLSDKQRNQLLVEMTQEVADLVLTDNYQQTQAISIAEHAGLRLLDEHVQFLRTLEKTGRLERSTWSLPSAEELARRRTSGQGLTRPELSVLLAYSKMDVFQSLLASDVFEDAFLAQELTTYFPTPIAQRFAGAIQHHRLRRELIATYVANNMVNRMGITFAFRTQEHTGARAADIARAYFVARNVFSMPACWSAIEALDSRIDARLQLQLLAETRKLLTRATRWFLRNCKQPIDIAATIATYQPGVDEVLGALAQVLDAAERQRVDERIAKHRENGVPEALAQQIAALPVVYSALDITEVASGLKRPVAVVAPIYFALGAHLDLPWLRDQIGNLPEDTRWTRLARAGLRDDLYRLHRTLTREALLLSPVTTEPQPIIENWLKANAVNVERYTQQLGDFKGGDAIDLALLTVAVSEARKLIHSSGTTAGSSVDTSNQR